MKKSLLLLFTLACVSGNVLAQSDNNKLIDICEKNTDKSYKVYNTSTTIAEGSTLTVRTSRYTDFYPVLSGKGSLELYCGGERSYLGNHSDKSYPDWTRFTGNVDVYPYKAVESNAGFYGAIMNTNGKSFSPEDANPGNKINGMLANNHVTLHQGAALATEKSAAGVRIGELNTEAGSRLYGYYKSQSATSSAYYLLGSLNTDAILAGRIASTEKNGAPDATQAVGIIKEGKGTYSITGNDNQISGSIRVNDGTLLINNDAAQAKAKKLSGGTGAMADTSLPIAYVFKGATLGGTGNIGGNVDLYGTIAPGVNGSGQLHIANYATSKACNLTVHPASVINCNITDAAVYSSLDISGQIIRSSMTEDFGESNDLSQVVVTLSENHAVKVGDSFTLVRAAKGRENAGVWFLKVVVPNKLTWEVSEKNEDDGSYTLSLTCVSLDDDDNNSGGDDGSDSGNDEDDTDDDNTSGGEAADIPQGLYLRQYLEMLDSDKRIGVAVPSTWTFNVPANPVSNVSKAISNNFNLCVAENEMKMDALEPSQNSFNYTEALNLIQFARAKKMDVRGHTLCWHSQVPQWISKDGKNNDKGWTRAQLLKILENHIMNIVPRFKDWICEWDVVNETLDDDQSIVRTKPTGYQLRKESVWVKVIGEDFIDSAFVYAHRANPNIKLYLNDYGCEYSGGAKTTALYNLAKRLKDSGIPIAGVGLQCHLSAADFDKAKLDATVKKYAKIGLNCIFTEIDLAIYSNTASEQKKQADAYKAITEVFLNNDNCPHMIVWGINDKYSWISDRNPLLFDTNTKEKPAYYSVQSAVRSYVATGIKDIKMSPEIATSDEDAVEIARYNAAGQLVNMPCKGLNIVKLSNGAVRKEMR